MTTFSAADATREDAGPRQNSNGVSVHLRGVTQRGPAMTASPPVGSKARAEAEPAWLT